MCLPGSCRRSTNLHARPLVRPKRMHDCALFSFFIGPCYGCCGGWCNFEFSVTMCECVQAFGLEMMSVNANWIRPGSSCLLDCSHLRGLRMKQQVLSPGRGSCSRKRSKGWFLSATAGRVFIVLWYEKGGRRSVSSDQVLLDQLNPFPSKGMQPN